MNNSDDGYVIRLVDRARGYTVSHFPPIKLADDAVLAALRAADDTGCRAVLLHHGAEINSFLPRPSSGAARPLVPTTDDTRRERVIAAAMEWAASQNPEPDEAAELAAAVEEYVALLRPGTAPSRSSLFAAKTTAAAATQPAGIPPLPTGPFGTALHIQPRVNALPRPVPAPRCPLGPHLTVLKAMVKDDADTKLATAGAALSGPLPLAAGPDPDVLEAVLLAEFPWLGAVIAAITDDMRLRRGAGQAWAKWRPLLMVGPPGSGKSRLARRVAQLVGAGFGEVVSAGSSDNRALQGTARGWRNASPGQVLHVIRDTGFANPTMLVDEIDKTSPDGRNGDVRTTLLALLEPLTAKAWADECLMVPCDLSAVNWLLCANSSKGLPSPLLSRLRVIAAPAPGAAHFPSVLAGMRRDLADDLGVRVDDLPPLDRRAEAALYAGFKRGLPLRRVRAAIEGAIRAAGGVDATRLAH